MAPVSVKEHRAFSSERPSSASMFVPYTLMIPNTEINKSVKIAIGAKNSMACPLIIAHVLPTTTATRMDVDVVMKAWNLHMYMLICTRDADFNTKRNTYFSARFPPMSYGVLIEIEVKIRICKIKARKL